MGIGPILEIYEALASRGHVMGFATFKKHKGWLPFVSAVHIVGCAITPAEDEHLYLTAVGTK